MSIFTHLGINESKGRLEEEALYNLAACYGLAEKRVTQSLKPFGLSAVMMNALLVIKHLGGDNGVSQAEIGKRMIVSAGNITRLLDRLERQGMVRRVPDPNDRRVKKISVTAAASKRLERAWPVYLRCVDGIVSALSRTRIRETAQLLNELRESLCQKREASA